MVRTVFRVISVRKNTREKKNLYHYHLNIRKTKLAVLQARQRAACLPAISWGNNLEGMSVHCYMISG